MNDTLNIDPSLLDLGLYLVAWKTGGFSLASVGMTESGGRWLAPTNWVHPTEDQDRWREVRYMTLLAKWDNNHEVFVTAKFNPNFM